MAPLRGTASLEGRVSLEGRASLEGSASFQGAGPSSDGPGNQAAADPSSRNLVVRPESGASGRRGSRSAPAEADPITASAASIEVTPIKRLSVTRHVGGRS